MLLLLLLGAGVATPVVDGVRAYAQTTYRSATNAASAATTVTLASGGVTPLTNAETTED